MEHRTRKPVDRSKLRFYLGAKYFTYKRYYTWLFSKDNYAKIRNTVLDYEIITHATPLLRKLKDVDMYLQHNKIINLKLAVKKVNGVVIYPGETFSYWKLIGKPSKRKGYVDGMILKNGTVTAGTAGGLCQLSNMIYWLTIHTELTVTERYRHQYDVFPDSNRTQPFGSGATCFYNYIDLQIQNNTNHPYQLKLEITDHELVGSWYCDSPKRFTYEIYEKEHTMKQEYWGGYTRHNVIHRKVFDQNQQIDDQYVVENHAIMMYAPLLKTRNK